MPNPALRAEKLSDVSRVTQPVPLIGDTPEAFYIINTIETWLDEVTRDQAVAKLIEGEIEAQGGAEGGLPFVAKATGSLRVAMKTSRESADTVRTVLRKKTASLSATSTTRCWRLPNKFATTKTAPVW